MEVCYSCYIVMHDCAKSPIDEIIYEETEMLMKEEIGRLINKLKPSQREIFEYRFRREF